MRPDEITDEAAEYAVTVHRAKAIAKKMGYETVADCAKGLYGWPGASTLTPAEYIVARWRLARIDEYWAPQLAQARDQRQSDFIAAEWERQTRPLEARVGA